MNAIASRSAGVILFPKPELRDYTVYDLVDGAEKDPVEAQHLYSFADDWEEITGENYDALLKQATHAYWLARTVSHLRLAIGGLEKSLEKRVLEDIEENVSSHVSSEEVLNHLLIAPLADDTLPDGLARSALSLGFASTASILDDLKDIQPLLQRFTDMWLTLSEMLFSEIPETKEEIWLTLIEKHGISNLLKSHNGDDFENKWNLLVFYFTQAQTRLAVSAIGKEISHSLFPIRQSQGTMETAGRDESDFIIEKEEDEGSNVYEKFIRVEKQIDAIVRAVSEGRDKNAKKFLRELITHQISTTRDKSFAVKSLCNIAKHCADMFRTDFESLCLNEALRLDPSDAWALIQQGDYLKRMGRYDEALTILRKAQRLGESVVGISSEADVYSQQGSYSKAIEIYESIPNWREESTVLMAIADNLRKMGLMDQSQASYRELIKSAQLGLPHFADDEQRAHAGLAEIAKKQGKLEEALLIYQEILRQELADDRDKVFYRLGLCNVLKLMERFDEAYSIVGNVIGDYPFAMEARFIRGSILGLIGREKEGLKDLPESTGSRSWREWLRHYYRGLLLFRLERYEDAKENLVEELNKAIASKEEKSILRMAAALCFLRENETTEADGILSVIPDLHDSNIQYLSLVLKLHSATQKEDRATINSLKRKIVGLQIVDAGLDKAVEALDKRNFAAAFNYETDALLKLAA